MQYFFYPSAEASNPQREPAEFINMDFFHFCLPGDPDPDYQSGSGYGYENWLDGTYFSDVQIQILCDNYPV